MKLRAATNTDGYKVGHGTMYADGTTKVYSNLTPRSDKIYRRGATKFYDGLLVWAGAQGAVQEIAEMWDVFFKTPKELAIGRYARRLEGYLGGLDSAVAQMEALHELGYLPLQIRALPQGVKVDMGIPVMTITNTRPEFYWLVNYLETVISDLTWKTATNATIAAEYRAIVDHYGDLTGTDMFSRAIQCHDFSMRGMSGPEDAARTGIGHLLSFIGTDTLPAMDFAEDYYDADPNSLIAISVPATEHAVATSNILHIQGNSLVGEDARLVAEIAFMKDLITRKFPKGIVSYVADSFDFWGVLAKALPVLKDTILAREASDVAPGKLVIRPDSGDPVEVICGVIEHFDDIGGAIAYYQEKHYEQASEACEGSHCMGCDSYSDIVFIEEDQAYFKITTEFEYNRHDKTYYYVDNWGGKGVPKAEPYEPSPEEKGAIQVLWEIFGGTTTDKGYKLLDSHIGLIYGDSITTKRAEEILRRLAEAGFASGNVVFGVGSYTYQCNTRDTFGFAVKATYTEIGDVHVPIFKDPKTDAKKKSAKGLLYVKYMFDKKFHLEQDVTPEREAMDGNQLQLIFEDGKFVKRTNLEEMRSRLGLLQL